MRPARKFLLRHGFAVTLEFCRLVQALEPPAPVRCIIAVNDTNGTFRRAALAQLHGDADGTTAFAPGPGQGRRGRVDAGPRPRGCNWLWPSGCAAGSPWLSASSLPASPDGGRWASAAC